MGSLGSTEQPMAIAVRAAHAQSAVSKHLLEKYKKEYNKPHVTELPTVDNVIVDPHTHTHDGDDTGGGSGPDTSKKICIIGAGAAGLAAAMSLHECGFYNIDILEASERAGGRLFTYEFSDDETCKHNYCDIGAMRIPDIPRMQPTLALLDKLGIKRTPYYYNLKDLSEKESGKIVPTMWWFQNSRPESKRFLDTMDTLLLKCGFLTKDPRDEKKRIAGDFEVAYKIFMKDETELDKIKLDSLSTRQYLLREGYSYHDTLHAELATSGRNGTFDQALLETICDYLDFQQAQTADWYRVEGGMKVLVDAMVAKVAEHPETKLRKNTPVVALKNDKEKKKIYVTTKGKEPEEYDAVFNTTAMPCLERMDISELGLPIKILTGIRSLHYDNSAKVTIKFRKAWWMDWLKVPGGVSATDLPISNIVYPSFDIAEGEPAVLLASYSWSQDAIRMAALFHNTKPGDGHNVDDEVVTQVLKNIEQVWSKSGMENPPSYEFLRDMYVDHFAWSWDQDKYTGGAFALFGPGQFQDFYADFQDPHCQGKFLMCGEAISVEHAWISGALKSAYCAVLKWTRKRDLNCGRGDICQTLLKKSILGGGKGQHPLELDESLLYWTVKLQDVDLEKATTKPAAVAA
ncbi:hypothetical protein Micbo1qcDRAFT_235280 [Microdochium bolleyi]|uniref:Amine oxidase domain-containing protein n=1 Tax=Microdochium bolleyi TaxID=196109 RepID=A0A136IXM4_9PEZI|nr:hypothetical protein Micbo1qcDRAFT_235280 [Microdochium bolleyi]